MGTYRVYALDARNHIEDLAIIEHQSDAEALHGAREVARQRKWRRAEVWQTSRLIGRVQDRGDAH
jgi:hypothetical protein